MRSVKQFLILLASGLALYAIQIVLWIRSISHSASKIEWPGIIGSCLLILAAVALVRQEHKRTFRS
jgi:hypothetical protein